MSPKNKIKLNLLRKELDKIDNNLLKIIHKRTKIIKKVLTLKSYKKEIIDKKRISAILKKIRKESLKKNIDPKITQRIWKNMIWSYVNFEKKILEKNNYLLCGGSFFSIKTSCFLVAGLYFLAFNLTLAFSPPAGFFT